MSLTLLAFLTAYFGCLIKAFSSKPIWGLYAYFIAFYAHPISRWWGASLPDLRWSFIAALVTLIALVAYRSETERRWFEFKEAKLYAVFVVFLFLQYFWVLSSELHSIFVQLAVKYLILIFLIQGCVKGKKDIIGFIGVNVVGALYFAYLGSSYSGGRLEGIGGPSIESSNGLGQHLAILLTFSSYLLFIKLGKYKPLLIIAIVFILNTIMLTQSRGSIVALGLTGIVSLFFIPKGYKKHFLILASLGAIAFSILIGPQILERFDGMGKDDSGEIKDKSAGSRLVIIKSQYEMFKESPILGQGHRSTFLLSPYYIPQEYMTKIKSGEQTLARRASHNFIMGMLTDHGLLGSGIYLLIIFSIAKYLFKLKGYSAPRIDQQLIIIQTGLCLAFFCYMVAGLFSNNKIYEISVWLIAIIPIVDKLLKNSQQEKVHVN